MSSTFDLFELLELDPGPPEPGRDELRRQLDARIERWHRDRVQGNPKQQRLAQVNLERQAEIEAVLDDPTQLRAQVIKARARRKEERKHALMALDESIEILRGSGHCDEKTLERLIKRYAQLTRAEIEKRLRAAGVSLEKPERRRRADGPEPLDRKLMAEIRSQLEILEHDTLYAFLELRPQSSIQALRARAQEIYQDNIRHGRKDVRSTAASELAGKCREQVFVDDESRARYDAALAIEALQDLRPDIELAGADRTITVAELDKLVEMARRRGAESDAALDFILELADKKKWVVHVQEELAAEALRRCGFCLALNQPEAERCGECGEALDLDCPRCGVATPSSARACAHCGCRTGDASQIQDLLTTGRQRIAAGQLAEAKEALDEILTCWPGWQPATEALNELERRVAALDEARGAIEALAKDARFFTARSRLERSINQFGRGPFEGLQERIDHELRRADARFNDARRHLDAGRIDDGLAGLEACLAICADHAPASRALAEYPPEPPEALDVSELPDGFRLRWQPGPGRFTGYLVVRKAGGLAHNAEDGHQVARVAKPSVDDVGVEAGVPWFYTVFAERAGIASVAGAGSSSGPHRRLSEVGELSAVAGDRQVVLGWVAPAGCHEVEVVRLSSSGVSRREWRVAGDSLADRSVSNGVAHRYQITALFPPFAGQQEARARGQLVDVVPEEPAPPVLDLQVVRDGRAVVASWTPVEIGRVELRRLRLGSEPHARPLPEGHAVALSAVDSLGSRIPDNGAGRAEDRLPSPGVFRYTPITLGRGQAIVGRSVTMTSVDPVTDLRFRMTSGALVLLWTWPPEIDRACISWSHEAPVDRLEGHHGPLERITREAYDRRGYWRLARPESAAHYFAVFAESPEGAHSQAAHVVARMGREIAVRYRLVRERSGLLRRVSGVFLEMRSEDAVELPNLVVVSKQGGVPISSKDGKRVAVQEPFRLAGGQPHRIDIPRHEWTSNSFFKLFLAASGDDGGFRLLPAARDELGLP